jgi:apolipoprotein N-acyltransferase
MGMSCWPTGLTINACTSIISVLLFCFYYKSNPLTYISALLFGFILTLCQFHWIAEVFRLFTDSSTLVSIIFALSMYLYASLQFTLLVFIGRIIDKIKILSATLILPLSWTLAEILFPKFIPWSQGATLISITPLIKIADLGGVPLVSFLLFLTSNLTIEIINSKNRIHFLKSVTLIILILGISGAYTKIKNQALDRIVSDSRKINVAFIQPNLNPATDFTFENLPYRTRLLEELTTNALNSEYKPDLIIWPESSVGYTFYTDENFISQEDKRWPFKNLQVPLIFGGQVQIGKIYSENTKFHNAGLLLLPNGELYQDYYKEILFPFSEETPLSSIFPALEDILKPIANYKEGNKNKAQSINLGDYKIALRICFEDIWTNLFYKQVTEDGANLLVSISNDGWFSNTSAMYQHHLLSLWRAVENDRYLLRIGNNGITELISPKGEIIKSYPNNTKTSGVFENIPLLSSKL